jgi:hypothetical protein
VFWGFGFPPHPPNPKTPIPNPQSPIPNSVKKSKIKINKIIKYKMEKIRIHMKTLYEERKKYIDETNYIKAEEISQKIQQYKNNIFDQQKKEFNKRKQEDQEAFEKDYNIELSSFNQRWNSKEQELKRILEEKEKELINNQKRELNEYINNASDLSVKQKISPNYLNMKKVEMTLVKQERFLEAEQMKQKAEKLLKEENRIMEMKRQKMIKKQIEILIKRQKEELAKFKDDKEKQLYLIQKDKNKEYDMIINKFRTIKVEIMLKQKDDENKAKDMLKKTFRLGKRSMSQETRRSPSSQSNFF